MGKTYRLGFFIIFLTATVFSQFLPHDGAGKMPPPPGCSPDGMLLQGPGHGPSPMLLNMADLASLLTELNIEKATSSKIMTIARAFSTALEERVLKIQKEELNIKEELLKDKPDFPAIQSIIARKTQIIGELEFAQIKRDCDIKALLTQEEYDRWKALIMKRIRNQMQGIGDKKNSDDQNKHGGQKQK